ncbi:hypothetical protein Y1Q_0004252 [Alligator mississippiensis]|uniref:Uncharacterized protein n=1 Tax=Alligator mississippiensis TaxID=8496 RepID=A0A151MI44_ALLMI|nr:hypothetical protein Y1Q_0004252 [Alligator mississippiensis]
MLLGRNWASIYDVLDRVRDAEGARKRIQSQEGWLGELEEDKGPTDETNMLDLDNLMSSILFRDAQEKDPEIGTLREQAQGTKRASTLTPEGRAHFEAFEFTEIIVWLRLDSHKEVEVSKYWLFTA